MNRIAERIIAERRAESGKNERQDLLSRLMRARDEETGAQMSDVQLKDEVITLLLAGHETTANALGWTLHLLSTHPEIQNRLHEELHPVLSGIIPTLEDLPRLPYTRQVLEESMRLYPPAAMLSRNANSDDVIAGYPVPKDSLIQTSIWIVHRHPAYWDRPTAFDPERFVESRATNRHPFAYIPFGAGPRECVGKNFAMVEAMQILAGVIGRFEVRPVPGHPIEVMPLVTLRPRYGIPLVFKDRR